jgi:glutathione S-transferase
MPDVRRWLIGDEYTLADIAYSSHLHLRLFGMVE